MTLISIEKTSRRMKAPAARLVACAARDTPDCELVAERHASALREQFIAVLGHDLRNPLSAIISGMEIITRSPLEERQHVVAKLVQSSAARMSALIDDVMDFARGRLGDGMSLNRAPVQIELTLTQVINELRSSQSSRDIVSVFDLPRIIDCDPGRLSQLLSNLLANALVHGSPDGPVTVRANTQDNIFELSVSNSGDPIPATAIARLFEPFTRDEIRPSQQGLGLGLYIASEIARAHGGKIRAISDRTETRFTFRMPIVKSETARIIS